MNASNSYLSLLRMPGAARQVWWASLFRLVNGVLPVALILLLAQRRHSYAEAGTAVAVYGITAGLLGPTRGRLADRHDPRWVLGLLGLALAAALVGITAAAAAPFPVLIALALAAGCTPPPVGPLTRTFWRHLIGADEGLLSRAYSLDATSEELLYVVAPLLAASSVAWWGGTSAVVGASITLLVAATAMAFSIPRAAHDGAAAASHVDRPPLWRDLHFLRGMAPIAGLGLLLGALEIAAISAVLAVASSSLAGVPAAAISAGSVVGGLIFGRHTWPGSVTQRARVLTISASMLVVLAAVVTHSFVLMVAVLAVAGMCISPAIVCSYLIADESAPLVSAEATSWVNTAFNVSLAAGYTSAGVLVDSSSAGLAMVAAAGVAIGVVGMSTFGRKAGPRAPGVSGDRPQVTVLQARVRHCVPPSSGPVTSPGHAAQNHNRAT